MISDTPGRRGEGGQKRANFCGRPLWMAPNQSIDRDFLPQFNLTQPVKQLPDIIIADITRTDARWIIVSVTIGPEENLYTSCTSSFLRPALLVDDDHKIPYYPWRNLCQMNRSSMSDENAPFMVSFQK